MTLSLTIFALAVALLKNQQSTSSNEPTHNHGQCQIMTTKKHTTRSIVVILSCCSYSSSSGVAPRAPAKRSVPQ